MKRAFVVLGNRMNDDGSLSDLMKERLALTLEAYEKFHPDYIICSGGLANKKAGFTESSKMKEYLLEQGIPKDVLLEENESLTTRQNAVYSAKIISSKEINEVMIISTVEHFTIYPFNILKFFKDAIDNKSVTLMVYTR